MSLKEIIMGSALALGACATVPKPVCSYEQNRGYCTKESGNAIVSYVAGISEDGTALCAVNIIYQNGIGFQVLDTGCDGTADMYVDYKLLENGVKDLSITSRNKANKEHDKLFSQLESLFRDKTFLKLKEKMLGDKK